MLLAHGSLLDNYYSGAFTACLLYPVLGDLLTGHLAPVLKKSLEEAYYDVVILWDVAMFMDLTPEYGGSCLYSLTQEIDNWVLMAKHYIMFSLHPVKIGVIGSRGFSHLHKAFEEYCQVVDKKYHNRLYKIRWEKAGQS